MKTKWIGGVVALAAAGVALTAFVSYGPSQVLQDFRKTYPAAGITRIEVDTVRADVIMEGTQASDLQLECVGQQPQIWREELRDGVLKIQQKPARSGFLGLFSTDSDGPQSVHVLLPRSVQEMEVHSVSGATILKGVDLERLQQESVSGDVQIYDSEINDANLKTISGSAEIASAIPQLRARTISGNLQINQHAEVQTLDLETTSGSALLEFNRVPNATLKFQGVSGALTFLNREGQERFEKSHEGRLGTGKGSIRLRTVSGDVQVRPHAR